MVVEAWGEDSNFFPVLSHQFHLMVNAWHGEVVEGHVHPRGPKSRLFVAAGWHFSRMCMEFLADPLQDWRPPAGHMAFVDFGNMPVFDPAMQDSAGMFQA
jgi:hypothetical protein